MRKHVRSLDGLTHEMRDMRNGRIACGARTVPGCTVTTLDPIDCMNCLAGAFSTQNETGPWWAP